jgi:uncharacterized protein YydD (DUF2326 family)
MYLEKLTLYKNGKLLREPIVFKKGLNLIINSSPKGNSVGKTTFLHLVKYCLGGKITDIYKDEDKEKSEFNSIEEAFKKDKYDVKLDINIDGNSISIERQLSSSKNATSKINNTELNEEDFQNKISTLLIQKSIGLLPSWQQLKYKFIKPELKGTPIKFNTRIKSPELYTMWLFLLGYKNEDVLNIYNKSKQAAGNKKTSNISSLKNRVLVIEEEIKKLNIKKDQFIFDKYTETQQQEIKEKRDNLDKLKQEVSILQARITNIEGHLKKLKEDTIVNSDLLKKDIRNMYNQAKIYGIEDILEDYENVIIFHSEMLSHKSNTLNEMLKTYQKELEQKQSELNKISSYEKEILDYLTNKKLLPAYDSISKDLNEKHELLGQAKEQLNLEQEISEHITNYKEAEKNFLESKPSIGSNLKSLSSKFNKYCKDVLGEENHHLEFTNDTNLLPIIRKIDGKSKSSGEAKKNIVLLDLAYLSFSINNKDISVPHFIMIDSIENIDEIDLDRIFRLSDEIKEGQVIFTCLKDKLHKVNEDFLNKVTILALSKEDKLLKIISS